MLVSEKRKAAMKTYYWANRDKIIRQRKEYRKKNSKAIRLSIKADIPMDMARRLLNEQTKS